MSSTDDTTWICPSRPFGHDWNGGLHCRGCDATRTAREALESLLAGQRGWDNTRAAALVELHALEVRATPAPLVVSRFDVGMEPAPEEEQLFTVGAIAEDGRPVALLFDKENRRKVGGWLAAGQAAEIDRLRIAWGMARTRARSAMSGADRYAARASELQTALQDSVFAVLAVQMERDALRTRVTQLEAELRIGTPWKCHVCGKDNRRDVCVICETDRPETEEAETP